MFSYLKNRHKNTRTKGLSRGNNSPPEIYEENFRGSTAEPGGGKIPRAILCTYVLLSKKNLVWNNELLSFLSKKQIKDVFLYRNINRI